jgi:lipopolysaccharide export system protein LptA
MLDAKMIDEVTGTLITWDNRTEFFTVDGGAPTTASPSGRVRMLLSPRQAASGPAAAASSPPKAASPATTSKAPRSAGAAGK